MKRCMIEASASYRASPAKQQPRGTESYRGKRGKASFAAETAMTRISRDVFLYDPSTNEFCVKEWGSAEHRASARYGNAFGTFLCRPPKDEKDMSDQLSHAKRLTFPEGDVLHYDVQRVIGHKTADLESVLKKPFLYNDASFVCYAMPSSEQSVTSLIAAPMTVLAYFLPVQKRSLTKRDTEVWISSKEATDPSINVHAGVVSAFLFCKNTKPSQKVFEGADVSAMRKHIR
jgi:hypothetical protein